MKYIIDMAIRNTKRNKRRSTLAIISVALALLFIVFMKGFLGGFLGSMVKNTTRLETGHIRITTAEFREKEQFMPVTENLENPESIISKIMADAKLAKEIDMITPRINFGVLLSNDGNNKTSFALAGDQENEKILSNLDESIIEGKYLENSKDIIIGYKLAEILKYKIGDEVKVMTQGSDYALHLKKFKIVGIYKTHINSLDEDFFQIRLDDAQKLLRMSNSAQQIMIMLHDYTKAEEVAQRIKDILGDETIAVNPWSEVSVFYDYIQMASSIYNWIYGIFALLGAFIIGNIMMMVVMERRHEIGIVKSMGISKNEVMTLFLAEGMIMGFIGSVIGTVIALIIIVVINMTGGMDFTKMMSSFKGFPMDNIVILSYSTKTVINSIILGTAVSSLVSILPSRKAAKMNVVDSLKSV